MSEFNNEYREQRLANMAGMQALGLKPYGGAFARTGRIADIRVSFEENRAVRMAGRLMSLRDMGKSLFADLNDGTGRFQVYAQQKHLGDAAYAAFKLLDLGDFVGVEGTLFTTRTGEQSVKIDRWTPLAKALRPLPEKWHGLRDVEARYRHRYLDLAANPEVRALFDRRHKAVREIRNFLHDRGFVEVETPMIQGRAGGAAATPFRTHYTALGTDMFLRIAPELYLKRLLVGGFDRVFEMNRNFRNEGLDRTHNPEFTMLEIYEAYSDLRGMKSLVQDLIVHVAQQVMGTLKVGSAEHPIDLTPPWREVAYRDLIVEHMGPDWYQRSAEEAASRARELGLAAESGWGHRQLTHEIYEKTIERTLQQPTFVTRLPTELVPLARTCEDDPTVVDVFELEIGGKEIAPAYSELNDPLEQRRRLEQQGGGQTADEDFIDALEHGMPPAGGMGLGIDRLLMILTGSDAIRDVILFPQLRPHE